MDDKWINWIAQNTASLGATLGQYNWSQFTLGTWSWQLHSIEIVDDYDLNVTHLILTFSRCLCDVITDLAHGVVCVHFLPHR